jgi:hypothetical protein
VKEVGTHPQGSGLLLGREVVVIRLIHRDKCEPRFCAAETMHRARPSDFRSMRGLSQDFISDGTCRTKKLFDSFFSKNASGAGSGKEKYIWEYHTRSQTSVLSSQGAATSFEKVVEQRRSR